MEQGPILIRAIRPADWRRLKAFYARLSPDSLATRFLGARRGISDEEALAFAGARQRSADGMVAIERSSGKIVGHLCLEPIGGGVEEIAVATADPLHGRGIGRELVKAAAASGRRRGARAFVATMLTGNRGIHRLLQRAGIPWRRRSLDATTERLTLDLLASSA